MASIMKVSRDGIGGLFRHNNRTINDGATHSNKEIDASRTHLNYHIKYGGTQDALERLQEVFSYGKKNEVKMCEINVTLPKNVPHTDLKKFFRAVYDFYVGDFGEKNIINAVVHLDETTPHIHIDFIPAISRTKPYQNYVQKDFNEWKQSHEGNERLCARDLITREYLKMMHIRLSHFVERALGYRADILNGATAGGNRTVLAMKNEALLEKQKEYQKVLSSMEGELKKLLIVADRCGIEMRDISLLPLLEQIRALKTQNTILQDIIAKHDISYTKDQLQALRTANVSRISSQKVTIRTGRIAECKLEEDAIIVLEAHDNPNGIRPILMQKDLLEDRELDIERCFRRYIADKSEVKFFPSREKRYIYVFIRASDEMQTVKNLYSLTDILKEIEHLDREEKMAEKKKEDVEVTRRKVYMEQLTYDKYHFARNILERTGNPSMYLIPRTVEKEKTVEQERKEQQ